MSVRSNKMSGFNNRVYLQKWCRFFRKFHKWVNFKKITMDKSSAVAQNESKKSYPKSLLNCVKLLFYYFI